MKKTTIILALAIGISSIGYGQAKKQLVITVDSADAVKFLNIFSTGIDNLMNSNIPAKDLQQTSVYGQILLQREVSIYNSWFLKPKTDSAQTKKQK